MPLTLLPRSAPVTPRPVGRARGLALLILLAVGVAAAACGKRGAPLPPLARVPAAVTEWTAMRRDDTVALTLVVPSTNVSGDAPGDIAAVEVYAVTAALAPELETGRVPPSLTLVAQSRVRRPLPPVPATATDVPAVPREPGLDQGEQTTFSERLTPEILTPQSAAEPTAPGVAGSDGPALSPPLVFVPAGHRLKRHYVAVAVSRRGVRGAWSAVRSVPIGPVSGAPAAPAITYDAAAISLTWTPAPDARAAAPPAGGDLLESRPLGPPVAATRYRVYATETASSGAAEAAAVNLTAEPLAQPEFSVSGVTFGRERCFVVHGVDTLDGVDVEGPPSPPACVTPVDTFAPPAPTALEAIGAAGVVSLIWEGVEAADLAGYLVFRGEAGSEPATLLTPAPIRASSFEDRTVTPGTRYVYVVVAVDSATPANRSGPSNRAEETARQ